MKMFILKRFALIVAMIVVSVNISAQLVWDGTATTWTNGSGTESDPYLIETPQHLAWLAFMVNNGMSTYSGVYFKQTEDFNMNGSSYPFTVIGINGNGGTYFSGNYDGNLKNIYNLVITNTSTYMGLFGYTSNANFKRICIRGIQRNGTTLKEYVGSICGYANGGSLVQCCCIGNVNTTNSSYYNLYMGGLVGYANNTRFERCFVKGNIILTTSYTNYTGGLIGRTYGSSLSINSCYFVGEVRISATKSSCYTYSGLITGYAGNDGKVRMSKSYAVGGFVLNSNCYDEREDIMIGEKGSSTVTLSGGNNLICGTTGNYSSSYATQKTNFYMKSTLCLNDLNAGNSNGPYFYDMDTINDGYPILDFQQIVRYYTIATSYDKTQGSVTGGGVYANNSTVTLQADAKEGYLFAGWSDGNIENPRTVTVTSDATYTAVFTQNAYTIRIKHDCSITTH